MLRTKSASHLAGPLLVLFLSFLLAGSAFAADEGEAEDAPKKWDAASATRLANSLEETLEKLYQQSLTAPVQPTALQQRERDAAQGQIKRARDLGADYARRMRMGWTRADSEPYFQGVVDAVDQIWETAGDAEPAAGAQPGINRMGSILEELKELYEAS